MTARADLPPNYELIDINNFNPALDGLYNDSKCFGVAENNIYFVGRLKRGSPFIPLQGFRGEDTPPDRKLRTLTCWAGGDAAIAYAVLDTEYTVGWAEKVYQSPPPLVTERPTLFLPRTEYPKINLPTINEQDYDAGHAYDIDSNMLIVGDSQYNASGVMHASYWEEVQTDVWEVTDLGTLSGGTDSCDRGKNIDDDIVGWAVNSSGDTRAVIWEPSGGSWTITDLGTLGGDESFAYDVNDSKVVVGWAETDDDPAEIHAAKWVYSGGQWNVTDLGTLGGDESKAYGINGDGDIVGTAEDGEADQWAVIWQGGQITNLSDDTCRYKITPAKNWKLREAWDINDDGTIGGWGHRSASGQTNWVRAFALRPLDCSADANGDGVVDVEDLIAVLEAWDQEGCRIEDVNEDLVVDVLDLLAVLANWSCGTTQEDPPEDIQDCFDKYGNDPEKLVACLETLLLTEE